MIWKAGNIIFEYSNTDFFEVVAPSSERRKSTASAVLFCIPICDLAAGHLPAAFICVIISVKERRRMKKELLTKEMIKKTLMQDFKLHLISCIAPFICMPILVEAVCAMLWIGWHIDTAILRYILYAVYITVVVLVVCEIFSLLQMIKKEKFTVIRDRLVAIKRDTVDLATVLLGGYHSKLQDVFYFEKCGKVVLFHYTQRKKRQYAACGEEFYLVIDNRGKKIAHYLYSTQVYRLAGEEA